MIINKIDTDGNKGLLAQAEFGYDGYTDGGDEGRAWIGDGSTNRALAYKSEVETAAGGSLTVNANVLTHTNGAGESTDIDLSVYLDDSNLARLVNGSLDAATGIATFTRDDDSTFTLDLSALLDDTTVTVIDVLTSTDTTAALSANQGKILKDAQDVIAGRVQALENANNIIEW